MIPAGMAELLDRKYAILQQNADATSEQARATTTNAGTNAFVGRAAAGLDNVRASLMPAESTANIGLTKANTGLVGKEVQFFDATARAKINAMRADTARTVVGTTNDYNMGVLPFGGTDVQQRSALQRYQGFRLGAGFSQ